VDAPRRVGALYLGGAAAAAAVGDHVGGAEDGLAVARRVDHADLDLERLRPTVGLDRGRAGQGDRLVVEGLGVLGQARAVGGHAAPLLEDLALDLGAAAVLEDDLDPTGEERELAQPAAHAGVLEAVDALEDVVVGVERHGRAAAALGRLAHDVERLDDLAVLEGDAVLLAVAPDLGLEPLRERVHDRG